MLYDLFKLNLGRKIELKVLANKKEETELEFREMRNWVTIIGWDLGWSQQVKSVQRWDSDFGQGRETSRLQVRMAENACRCT